LIDWTSGFKILTRLDRDRMGKSTDVVWYSYGLGSNSEFHELFASWMKCTTLNLGESGFEFAFAFVGSAFVSGLLGQAAM
jgi:hypothetical protein